VNPVLLEDSALAVALVFLVVARIVCMERIWSRKEMKRSLCATFANLVLLEDSETVARETTQERVGCVLLEHTKTPPTTLSVPLAVPALPARHVSVVATILLEHAWIVQKVITSRVTCSGMISV